MLLLLPIASPSLVLSSLGVLSGVGQVACPESQVVSEELHDSGTVSVLVLLQAVQVSDGIVKGSLG